MQKHSELSKERQDMKTKLVMMDDTHFLIMYIQVLEGLDQLSNIKYAIEILKLCMSIRFN